MCLMSRPRVIEVVVEKSKWNKKQQNLCGQLSIVLPTVSRHPKRTERAADKKHDKKSRSDWVRIERQARIADDSVRKYCRCEEKNSPTNVSQHFVCMELQAGTTAKFGGGGGT
jgi:hypothetical protein